MIARLTRRFLYALSLVVGTAALLFLIFDSGMIGEPGSLRVERGGSAADLALARQRAGLYRASRDDLLAVRALAAEPLELTAFGGQIIVRKNGAVLEQLAVDGLTVRECLSNSERFEIASLHSRAFDWPAANLRDGLAVQPARLADDAVVFLPVFESQAAIARFAAQLVALLTFDFGMPANGAQPITDQLWQRGLRSLALTVPAFVLATLVAIALALLAATLRGPFDRTLLLLSSAGMAISALAYVLFLQYWLAFQLGWFPIHGWQAPYWKYLALPVLIWLLVSLGPDLRFYRAVFLDQSQRDFVRTARAKGLSSAVVLRRHVLRNALLPILTQVSMALPYLLLGSLLLERFFGIPGLGGWTIDAVLANDQPVLRAATFVFALLYLAATWLADAAYAWADPRVRRAA